MKKTIIYFWLKSLALWLTLKHLLCVLHCLKTRPKRARKHPVVAAAAIIRVCHCSGTQPDQVLVTRDATAFDVNTAQLVSRKSTATAFGDDSDQITRFVPNDNG